MVYTVHTNRAMITNKPLKMKRKKNGRLEMLREFLSNHEIEFTEDASGEVVVVVKEIHK